MGLTVGQLRRAEWKEAFRAPTIGGEYVLYVANEIDGITVGHSLEKGRKTKISYTVRASGRQFDSPDAAVRHFNACEKARQGERNAAGSVDALKARKRLPTGAGHGDKRP